MRRRLFACVICLLVASAACGRDPDADSRRVVASPVPSASVDPLKTAAPRTVEPDDGEATQAPSVTRVDPTAAPPADPATLANARIKVTKLATFTEPVAMAWRRGDPAFYIAGRHTGEIRPVRGGQVGGPVVDVGDEIATGGEQGLLGLTFSPDGDKLYINFTSKTSQTSGNVADTVIREYDFDGQASSPREVLRIAQPAANHNGGNILFGRDGYLYIGMGDGGAVSENGQNLNVLLGKMLRIDPDPGDPDCGDGDYGIPSGNPFIGKSGCDEIWAYGLRNPWRFSFDRITGALWTGDVGASAWEEIDVATGRSDGGENYGWPRMEGSQVRSGPEPANHHGPIYQFPNDGGHCAVTGGYVYRGSKIPALRGAYVFADFCEGRLRAFINSGGRAVGHRYLGPQVSSLSSFGQDSRGELYVLSLDGGFYRIDPA